MKKKFFNLKDLFKLNKWRQDDFTIYIIVIFIIVIFLTSIINIIFYQLGFNFTNQFAFAKEINGKYGIVTNSGLTRDNFLYIISWFVLIFSMIATTFWFISNIYLIKFSKKFVWYNQIALILLLFIDIIYGAWWIVITDLIEICFVQYCYFKWDQDEINNKNPYKSELNFKSFIFILIITVVFILLALILITPIFFAKDQTFYELSNTIPNEDNYQQLEIIEVDLDKYGYAFSYVQKTGLIYDINPVWDTIFAIMQISGIILLTKKNWFAWIFFEGATVAQFIIYKDAGNIILLVESVLLFIINLLSLFYYFVMNQKFKDK
ncbi:MAG: hypothetical protein HPPSJP_4900 [Candidatus Hepatoplasma scabrum]|nr:MAG: hypothetical protein HPPSJP_4900 [Candidatus Hepatoplasma sp.]